MFISEVAFPHLMADRDDRLTRQLERRRVVEERRAEEEADAPAARSGPRSDRASGWVLRRRRTPARARCATC